MKKQVLEYKETLPPLFGGGLSLLYVTKKFSMEKVYEKYVVEVPMFNESQLELREGDRILIKMQDTYKQQIIKSFMFYDKILLVKLTDFAGKNAITIKPNHIIGKIIKTIVWEEDFDEFVEKAPFDLASLNTKRLTCAIDFKVGNVLVKLLPKDKIDDIKISSNELYRGTYVPLDTDNEIDFILYS